MLTSIQVPIIDGSDIYVTEVERRKVLIDGLGGAKKIVRKYLEVRFTGPELAVMSACGKRSGTKLDDVDRHTIMCKYDCVDVM